MEPVERVKRTLAYKGRIIEVYKDNVRFSDGRESVWDYIDHVGAAAIIKFSTYILRNLLITIAV